MEEILKSGIYCIENKLNHKKYIGQSKDIKVRWGKHISELNRNSHDNDYLQKSWNKNGQDAFEFYILEHCAISELDDREHYYINLYDSMNRDCGYNLKSGGQNGGSLFSPESKEKLSKSIKESYTDELIEKRRQDALNQWANPEIKNKIMGKNNGMYGKHHSEESKKKMTGAKKGQISWRRNRTPVMCVETGEIFKDATDAGEKTGIQSSSILKVCQGERKTAGGYHWKFIEE